MNTAARITCSFEPTAALRAMGGWVFTEYRAPWLWRCPDFRGGQESIIWTLFLEAGNSAHEKGSTVSWREVHSLWEVQRRSLWHFHCFHSVCSTSHGRAFACDSAQLTPGTSAHCCGKRDGYIEPWQELCLSHSSPLPNAFLHGGKNTDWRHPLPVSDFSNSVNDSFWDQEDMTPGETVDFVKVVNWISKASNIVLAPCTMKSVRRGQRHMRSAA